MKKALSRGLITCLSFIALASCQDYDAGFTLDTIKKAEYAKHFEKTFGTPDPNQDWSMATLVKANVNLPGLTGTAKMNICTGDPRNSSTRLLAQLMLQDGKGSIDFDAIKGTESVFVTVEQDGEYKVYDQYRIYNGLLQLGNIETRSVAGKSDFSATCPTTKGTTVNNVFTGIETNVQKYHYNDKFYTIEELRAWATEHYTSTDVSNYAPFTSSCVISGTYDFTSASINTAKVSTISEAGYLFNGQFYTEAQLRSWANAEATAGHVTSSNYTSSTPFTDANVIPAGYNYDNPVVNTTQATPVVGPGYYFYQNGTLIIKKSREELITWSKENETYFNQYTLGSTVFINLSWDTTNSCVDYSTGEINTSNVHSFGEGTNYIYDNKVNSLQDLIDVVKTRESYIQNNGPLTNVYFATESIDFSTATLDNTKVTAVSAGNYIYDGQVFTDESALQSYTETNNLDNNGPYLNCCSGSHLDFTDAVVDVTQAPFENTTTSINLTFLNDVEKVAAEPWSFGWGQKLFGTGGFFQEQKCYFKSPKYGTLYGREELDKIEAGLVIDAIPGEPIELPFIYGATITPDQFGYVYWTDGEDPLTKPHYVLMEDARPHSNIYWDEWQGNKAEQPKAVGNMSLSVFQTYEDLVLAHKDDPVIYEGDGKNCYCNHGTGIWSKPNGSGEHLDECPQKTDPDAECICWHPTEGIFSSKTAEHLSTCQIPSRQYLAAYNQKVYGSSYRIMYFGDNGENNQGSYVFPNNGKVYHIAFFIAPNNAEGNLTDHQGFELSKYNYSWPELNKRIRHLYGADYDGYDESPSFEEGNNVLGDPKARGRVKTISWTQDGVVLLGFGDSSGDKDLNDIVFKVSGNFNVQQELIKVSTIKWHYNYNHSHDTNDGDLFHTDNLKPGDSYTNPSSEPKFEGHNFLGWSTSPTGSTGYSKTITGIAPEGNTCYFAIWDPAPGVVPDPEPISWIFACEDLGGTFDYDFNDVVWKVQKVYDGSGNCTSAYVTVLAAGGTLPFTLKYNGTDICTKATAFAETASNDKAVNAGSATESKTPRRFEVIGIDQNWTVTGNIDKFVVVVENGGNSTPIQAYKKTETLNNKTPQVILLPGEWEWPTESTPIDKAYKNFTNWVTDSTPKPWSEWNSHKVNGMTVTQSHNVQ